MILKTKNLLKRKPFQENPYSPYTPINFSEVNKLANQFADTIESCLEDLTNILLTYESYEVVKDEVSRTLDLLRNLEENKKYFSLRVGPVTSFLPRNQPLYAFSCFVVIPSLMSNEVHFRIPHSMKDFFPKMMALLNVSTLFPNIIVSHKQRIEFIKERSAVLINPRTNESKPITDAVIFTGLPPHANKLRMVFDKRTLFITNGAGHNPVIVSEDADLYKAVTAVTILQFYNQGQDCAAPNVILVHKSVVSKFMTMLRKKITAIEVGDYKDRLCKIGPINDPDDLVRIQNLLVENQQWLDSFTKGIIRTSESIVEPTIIFKPLVLGGNFSEIFAPVVFVQEYEKDNDLRLYFEDSRYSLHAMYVTLYGTSNYVKNMIGKSFSGKIMHDKHSFLHNTHLHSLGIERGTRPYGGSGYGASNVSINGKVIGGATLPQRDIYNLVARPIIRKGLYKNGLKNFTQVEKKDVEKILRIKHLFNDIEEEHHKVNENTYFDTKVKKDNKTNRYIKIKKDSIYSFLEKPNIEYIAKLRNDDIKSIRSLKKILHKKSKISPTEFNDLLYAIPVEQKNIHSKRAKQQKLFFENIYQLLFAKKSGPRLGPFLWDVNVKEFKHLLDV